MKQKYSIDDITDLKDRAVFFDANVLIYLFWPSGKYTLEKKYARIFGRLLRQGNQLVVDIMVISEVINRVIRIEHEKRNKKNHSVSFKKYRDSKHGKEALRDIYTRIRNDILKRFTIVGKLFDNKQVDGLMVVDKLDFVDKSIAVICRENNFVLITNDADFKDADFGVLSENRRLLE